MASSSSSISSYLTTFGLGKLIYCGTGMASSPPSYLPPLG